MIFALVIEFVIEAQLDCYFAESVGLICGLIGKIVTLNQVRTGDANFFFELILLPLLQGSQKYRKTKSQLFVFHNVNPTWFPQRTPSYQTCMTDILTFKSLPITFYLQF